MCTAYKIGKKSNLALHRKFEKELESLLAASPRIIRPTHKAPVVMSDGTTKEMTWGFRRQMKGKGGKMVSRTIVNSREDKLSGHTWSKAFKERRCIIPAFSFFEWVEKASGMVPLEFEANDGNLLWIAGIWEEDKERGEVYSMITTEPNSVMEPVHDRMPAVLSIEQIQPFLDFDLDEFGPSSVGLKFSEAENFLSRKKKEAPPSQGELF